MEVYTTIQEIVQHYQDQELYTAVQFLRVGKVVHVKFVDERIKEGLSVNTEK